MSLGEAPSGSAGFMYFFSIFMGIAKSVDEVREIRMGGKLGWQGHANANAVYVINQPDLFGGLAKEGGIVGNFHFLPGADDQVAPDSLNTVLVSPAVTGVGFRRRATAFFDGMVSALNPYPKPWSLRCRRITSGWDGSVFRPDIAKIELQGTTVAPPADTRPALRGDRTKHVPFTNVASVVVDGMFGGDITAVLGLSVNMNLTGEPNFQGVPYETEVIDSNTWRFKVSQIWYGHQILISYISSIGGLSSFSGTLDEYTGNSIFEMETGIGYTLVAITLFQSGGVPIPYTIITNDPNHLVLHIPARYLNQPLTIDYIRTNGFSTGSGPTQVITPTRLTNPAIVDLELNEGDTLVALLPGSRTVPPPEPAHEVYAEIVDIDEHLVAIHDVAAEGGDVYIPFLYKAGYGSVIVGPDSVIFAMNPAHILFECQTNREWGLGRDRATLNMATWEAAAETLYAEGFGLCMKWARRDSIKSFMQNVLDHIGAAMYTDRSDLLITLKLIRGDYVKASLPLFTTSTGLLTIEKNEANTASVQVNEVVVTWHDPVLNEDRWVTEQNLASLQSTNGIVNSVKKNYTGLPTDDLARRVCLRDLKAQSMGLRRYKLTMDRRGWNMLPGKVFRIEDQSRGIPDTVVRVATFKDGTLQDGRITLEVVQDVFSFPASGFTQPQPPQWNNLDTTPCIDQHEVFELPYYMLVRTMRPADFAFVDESSAYIGTVAAKGQAINTDYAIAVRDAAPTGDDVPAPGDQLYCGYTP